MQEFLYDIVSKTLTDANQRFIVFVVILAVIIISSFILVRTKTYYYISRDDQDYTIVGLILACIFVGLIVAQSLHLKSSASDVIRNKDLTSRIVITNRQDVSLDKALDSGLKIYDLDYDQLSKADLRFIDSSAVDTKVFIVDRGNEVEIYQIDTKTSVTIDQSEFDRYLKE